MRKIISILLIILAALGVSAQRATVERVEATPFEVIPAVDRRTDLNGEPCALVRVEVLADDVTFAGNVIGPVEHKGGQYRVYLSPGTKMLRIHSGAFLPEMITFPDYGISGVQPNGVYVITLSLPAAPGNGAAKTGSLYVNYEPAGAAIAIDNKKLGYSPSTITNISIGQRAVTISADGYLPVTLSANITEDNLAELKGTLKPVPATKPQPAAAPAAGATPAPKREETASTDNYIPFKHPSKDKFGFKDAAGNIVIPAKFDGAWDFVEGLAMVKKGNKYGYIDKTGKVAIPTKFDSADVFNDGLATVGIKEKNTTKYGFIDKSGNLVIPAQYYSALPFSDGMAEVQTAPAQWGYIDKTGTMVIPAKYTTTVPFADGIAVVGSYGTYWFINKKGEQLFQKKFEYAHMFSEGLASVKKELDMCGFIDKSGEYVIRPQFESAGDFGSGLAPVKSGNHKWGFIDKSGQFVLPPEYADAYSFSEGLAAVKVNDKWGFIDPEGNMVISPQFDSALFGGFKNGKARVGNGRQFFDIDRSGKTIQGL